MKNFTFEEIKSEMMSRMNMDEIPATCCCTNCGLVKTDDSTAWQLEQLFGGRSCVDICKCNKETE